MSIPHNEEESELEGAAAKHSKPAPVSKSGLVSYQDDVIDDDAVDDYDYSSDTATQDGVDAFERKAAEKMETSDGENEKKDENIKTDEEGNENSSEPESGCSRLPPEPPGKCSEELQAKIVKLYEKKLREGFDVNNYIQNNKNFRNPSIYEKLVIHCNIDELGTNYPRVSLLMKIIFTAGSPLCEISTFFFWFVRKFLTRMNGPSRLFTTS